MRSSRDAAVTYVVTAETCGCEGNRHHGRCYHRARAAFADWGGNGPGPGAPAAAPAAALGRGRCCRGCGGDGRQRVREANGAATVEPCLNCRGTGAIAARGACASTCGGGQACAGGECVTTTTTTTAAPCSPPCPTCQTCSNGRCVPADGPACTRSDVERGPAAATFAAWASAAPTAAAAAWAAPSARPPSVALTNTRGRARPTRGRRGPGAAGPPRTPPRSPPAAAGRPPGTAPCANSAASLARRWAARALVAPCQVRRVPPAVIGVPRPRLRRFPLRRFPRRPLVVGDALPPFARRLPLVRRPGRTPFPVSASGRRPAAGGP